MPSAPIHPGVYFEPARPAAADALPRMDIAAFVGFASSGPLHTPVAVEDLSRFRDIFGDDIPLAWDPDAGQMVCGHLGAAVTSFFRNGGMRCWVVRVADASVAHRFRFRLPGVIRPSSGGLSPMHLSARSAGNWSTAYALGSVLHVTQLGSVSLADDTEDVARVTTTGWDLHVPSPFIEIEAGDLVRVTQDDNAPAFYGFVDTVSTRLNDTQISGQSGFICIEAPTAGGPMSRWGVTPLTEADDDLLSAPLIDAGAGVARIQLLRCELLAWKDGLLSHRIKDVTFHPSHPRYVGHLPSDERLFAGSEGQRQAISSPRREAFLDAATSPKRFPFCGSDTAPREPCLPLGMGLAIENDLAEAAITTGAPEQPYDRNGLGQFTDTLFLDGSLSWTNAASLAAELERRHDIEGETVFGIHSLFSTSEITLVAVPDAVHRAWDRTAPVLPEPLSAPLLDPIHVDEEQREISLEWSEVTGATRYVVEQARDGEFDRPKRYTVSSDESPIVGSPGTLSPPPDRSLIVAMDEECEPCYFFRVRALSQNDVSPWSNARIYSRFGLFGACGASPKRHRDLRLASAPDPGGSTATLTWTTDGCVPDDAFADAFELQESAELAFESAGVYDYAGDIHSISMTRPLDGALFYRIRAKQGSARGPWSNTIRLTPVSRSLMTLRAPEQFDSGHLLSIHRRLIQLCRARGDLLAILSLPRHFRVAQVTDYVTRLLPVTRASESSAEVRTHSHVERDAMDFAALYYPWTAVRGTIADQPQGHAYHPPDGTVSGLIAQRTLERGAWIAPAGVAFEDVVALDPAVEPDLQRRLLSMHINILGQQPSGFSPLAAKTLGFESQKGDINVRRLVILLRRLALREGNTYVFEPNSDDFKARVSAHFEGVLEQLFQQGAFSGRSATQAYRVIADESVNTARDDEQGRFVMEIRVAPSRPLRFIRIRLLQEGATRMAVQEL